MRRWLVRYFVQGLSMSLCVAMSLAVCSTAQAEEYRFAIPPQYENASSFSEGLAAVMVGEKWGFIDASGMEVVPPRYDDVLLFHDGLAAFRVGDWQTGKWGYLDKAGNEVISPKYRDVGSFCEGLACVLVGDGKTGKRGFVDKTGREVVPPKYDNVEAFHDGLAAVWIAAGEDRGIFCPKKWGYVDKTGKEVVPVIYDEMGAFHEGLACVVKDGKMGFVDKTGAVAIPLTYAYDRFWNGVAAGYIDILPFFSEGLAALWGSDGDSELYGYIDRTGKVVIPFEYGFAGPFSEGLAYVTKGAALWYDSDQEGDTQPNKDGKFGYIDKTGSVVVPIAYDCEYVGQGTLYNWAFVDGLAQVSKRGATRWDMDYGLIDRTGKIVVPIRYHWIERTSSGLTYAGYGEDYSGHGTFDSIGLLNEAGQEIVAVDHYAWIEGFFEGYASVRFGGDGGEWMASDESKYGFIDTAGNEVVPCIFEYADDFSEGLAAVCIDKKWGYIVIAK